MQSSWRHSVPESLYGGQRGQTKSQSGCRIRSQMSEALGRKDVKGLRRNQSRKGGWGQNPTSKQIKRARQESESKENGEMVKHEIQKKTKRLGKSRTRKNMRKRSNCYVCSTEPHAEPGIFQSRFHLFGRDGRKPEDQLSEAKRAAREWFNRQGSVTINQISTTGNRQISKSTRGVLYNCHNIWLTNQLQNNAQTL